MSTRKVLFVPGEYYYIHNRGNGSQNIFREERDYEHFARLLFACNQKANFKLDSVGRDKDLFSIEKKDRLVDIVAYSLLPGHFHLLITEVSEGSISKFMQKLSTAYVMYHNKKYKRTGTLFEGKFKSEHADTDRKLKYIFSSIHLSPMKITEKNSSAGETEEKNFILRYLKSYPYSSFIDYLGVERPHKKILDAEALPKNFPEEGSFIQEIFDWMNYGSGARTKDHIGSK